MVKKRERKEKRSIRRTKQQPEVRVYCQNLLFRVMHGGTIIVSKIFPI